MSPQRATPPVAANPEPPHDWRRFLDRAIHDLSAPLRGIGTSAELLSEMHRDALNDDARQLVDRLVEGVGRMDLLLSALADYSVALQLDTNSVGSVPAEGVVYSALDTIQPLIKETGARIEFSSLPSVTGSWDQLSMLFRNLLKNSLQFRGQDPPKISISADREGTAWRFAVEDNGIGIDPQYWDRIFMPFERLHADRHNNAGLGLAISRRIVESHGGRIWLASRIGFGSTFFFTLPESVE